MARVFAILIFSVFVSAGELEDIAKNTFISGEIYGGYTSILSSQNKNINGQGYELKTQIKITSKDIYSVDFNATLLGQKGTDKPYATGDLKMFNTYGYAIDSEFIGIRTFSGIKTFEDISTSISAGYDYINSPFSDYDGDRGVGVNFTNRSIEGLDFVGIFYNTWLLDNLEDSKTFSNALFAFGINGNAQNFAGIGFSVWGAHINELVDYSLFGDVSYEINGVRLRTQMALTSVNIEGMQYYTSVKESVAKLRGLYNLQVGYDIENFKIKAGYVGSFGDGYGALFGKRGGFDVGGNLWDDFRGGGLSFVGDGSYLFNKIVYTSIALGYLNINYTPTQNLELFASLASISGNNNNSLRALLSNSGLDLDFQDIGVGIKYMLTKNVSANALYATTFGDVKISKAQAAIKYEF